MSTEYLWPLLAALALGGCASETLFRSNFDSTLAGQPPAVAQAVGTAHAEGPAGSVIVVAAPVQPSGKWLQISRPTGPQVASMQGRLAALRGDGRYTFSATLFMPVGSQTATLQFETAAATPEGFLHLDFLPDNRVRIDDDDSTVFGSFPRDQPFIVQVTLDINAAASTARIVLSGTVASGQKDYTVLAPFQGRSRQFGAVRVLQGFPHVGPFQATNIVVSRRAD